MANVIRDHKDYIKNLHAQVKEWEEALREAEARVESAEDDVSEAEEEIQKLEDMIEDAEEEHEQQIEEHDTMFAPPYGTTLVPDLPGYDDMINQPISYKDPQG